MFRRYRQRRGPYAMAEPSAVPSVIRSLILLAIGALILWYVGSWVLRLFGAGNQVQRSAITMQVENGGTVNVSLDGGLMQRAEDSLKLYPGDRVNTGSNGNAILTFFDGSRIRMDGQSDLSIEESEQGSSKSEIEAELSAGTMWMRTPDTAAFSGAILRTVITPAFRLEIPGDAEVVVGQRSLIVFSADGQGVLVAANDADADVWIGEGQQLDLPSDAAGDILAYRKAIDPLAVQSPFVEETRAMSIESGQPGSGSGAVVVVEDEETLVVTSPADKTIVTTSTVKVEGRVSRLIERVRVNGYQAVIDESQRTFSQELAVAEGTDTTITVEALDVRGVSIAKVIRTVTRGSRAVEKPGITFPAGDGQTYRTQANEIEIRGTAPAGTAGIMVNDYRLQLFRAGDTTWSYLASTALENLHSGSNVFDIFALDAAGNRSDPARITILVEEGSVGVVGGDSAASSATSSLNPATLPNNAPLMPGTLSVTGPTPGAVHTATGSEFLLEGTTPSATASVWVNDYRLQLYRPGVTFWNYIAKVEYQTLKPGTNVYRIVARNASNEILDTFEYTVTYNP